MDFEERFNHYKKIDFSGSFLKRGGKGVKSDQFVQFLSGYSLVFRLFMKCEMMVVTESKSLTSSRVTFDPCKMILGNCMTRFSSVHDEDY